MFPGFSDGERSLERASCSRSMLRSKENNARRGGGTSKGAGKHHVYRDVRIIIVWDFRRTNYCAYLTR